MKDNIFINLSHVSFFFSFCKGLGESSREADICNNALGLNNDTEGENSGQPA